MQTQRDHVHAHTFMMGRLTSALVAGDPTSAEIPGRRALTGLMIGLLVLILAAGGVAVYGWIVPGGSKVFKQAGVILVEKESGTRYVYLRGVLYPTTDLTSAMLIRGPSAQVKLISRDSLKGVPRATAIGIPGAPQSIPPGQELVAGPWLVCLPGSVADVDGDALGVNLDPATPNTPLPDDRFTVVRSRGGATYLLARGMKYEVTDDAVLVALGAANAPRVPAPQAWLDWLPDGPKIGPARIDGDGDSGPRIDGRAHPVGTIMRQRPAAGAEQYFVLRPDGLAPMSRTEFLFAEAASDRDVVDLDPSDVVDAPKSADRSLTSRLPDLSALRWHDPGDTALCVRQQPVSTDQVTSMVTFAPRFLSGVDAGGRAYVWVRPGSGMTVAPVPNAGGSKAQLSFIADSGTSFVLANDAAVGALKLNTRSPTPFPKSLLAVLPHGPTLSREAFAGLIEK